SCLQSAVPARAPHPFPTRRSSDLVAEPVSIRVESFGTGKVSDDKLAQLVRAHFDARPAKLIAELDLLKPIYKRTAAYGHFGREGFSWEQAKKADALKGAI